MKWLNWFIVFMAMLLLALLLLNYIFQQHQYYDLKMLIGIAQIYYDIKLTNYICGFTFSETLDEVE